MPAARLWSSSGREAGTPGLSTTKSQARNDSARWAPSSSTRLAAPARATSGSTWVASLSRGARSVSTTLAPCSSRNSAAAAPLRAAPTTSAVLSAYSRDTFKLTSGWASPRTHAENSCRCAVIYAHSRSAQLQSRQTEERKNNRHDPEPDHHLALVPARQLEVMVDRCHPEYAFPGEAKGRDLQDHRDSLEHADPADHGEEQLLLHQHRHGSDRAPHAQRPDVPHEHLRGMGVVPEETGGRSDHRAAEDRKLRRIRVVDQVEV